MNLKRLQFFLFMLAAICLFLSSFRLYFEYRYAALINVSNSVLARGGTQNLFLLRRIYDDLRLDRAEFFCLSDLERYRSQLSIAIYQGAIALESDDVRPRPHFISKLKKLAINDLRSQLMCSPQQGGALLQYAFLSVDEVFDIFKAPAREYLVKSYKYAPSEDWVIEMRFPLVSRFLEIIDDPEIAAMNRRDMEAIINSAMPPNNGLGFMMEVFANSTPRFQLEFAKSFSRLSPIKLQSIYWRYRERRDYFGLSLIYNEFPQDMKLAFRRDFELFPHRLKLNP